MNKKRFFKKQTNTFCQGLTPRKVPDMFWKRLMWCWRSLQKPAKVCIYADTICQGLSQGLCQEHICQELKPWQGHLRWADLLGILLLANVHLPRISTFCQGFLLWQNATFLVVDLHTHFRPTKIIFCRTFTVFISLTVTILCSLCFILTWRRRILVSFSSHQHPLYVSYLPK